MQLEKAFRKRTVVVRRFYSRELSSKRKKEEKGRVSPNVTVTSLKISKSTKIKKFVCECAVLTIVHGNDRRRSNGLQEVSATCSSGGLKA